MKRYLKYIRSAVLLSAILIAGYYAKAQTSGTGADEAILLIDVNNVIPEIEVIEKYLRENEPGTKLVVVPSYKRIPRDVRQKIQDIHLGFFDKAQKYVEGNYSEARMATDPKLREAKAITDKYNPILSQLTNGSGTGGQLLYRDLEEDLREALDEVNRSGLKFTRIIISGHHSADPTLGYLSGELLGGVRSTYLKEALNNDRRLDSVRSVMMLGCWTGLENMMTTSWGTLLPRANFHSGFITPAPLKTDPNNLATLVTLLKSEKTIGESKSEAELRQKYQNIKLNGRNIGVLVDGMYISNTGRVKRLHIQ